MSSDIYDIEIKIEPESSCTVQNDEVMDGYPKQALDLSKKNENNSSAQEVINKNSGTENKSNIYQNENDKQSSLAMVPEFVNIKMENIERDEYEATIKQEPNSDNEEDDIGLENIGKQCLSATSQMINAKNGRIFEVHIKQEPVELDIRHEINARPQFVVTSTQPNMNPIPLNDDEDEALKLNSTPDGKYMCPVCHNRFATKGLVQRHQLLHTKEKLQCTICFRDFVRAGHLKKHILSHSIVKTYDCPECGKQFKTTSNLEQHKKTHLAEKPFKCEVCKRQFAVKANLAKHQGMMKCKRPPDQPITCNVCHKTFKKEFLLRSHLRRHTTEKPYTCETCNESFKYKSTLIRHIMVHNGVKPYSCKFCQKTFTHAGLIKPHMRKHTGEKPYPCPICNKLFAHKHNMERHTLRHNKIKHLDCDVCHKRFPKESRLRYHMRIHTNEKPFACKICPKKFTHKQNVIRHYSRKHPGNFFNCELTDASFARDIWESVVQRKELKIKKEDLEPSETCENNDEYIIP